MLKPNCFVQLPSTCDRLGGALRVRDLTTEKG
jgi:hypothetical protein